MERKTSREEVAEAAGSCPVAERPDTTRGRAFRRDMRIHSPSPPVIDTPGLTGGGDAELFDAPERAFGVELGEAAHDWLRVGDALDELHGSGAPGEPTALRRLLAELPEAAPGRRRPAGADTWLTQVFGPLRSARSALRALGAATGLAIPPQPTG